MKWYISENGIDSDQCGRSAMSPCRTLDSVVGKFHTITTIVNPDLVAQVEDVWRQAAGQYQNSFDYWNRYVDRYLGMYQNYPTTSPFSDETTHWEIPNLQDVTFPDGDLNPWHTTTPSKTGFRSRTTVPIHRTSALDAFTSTTSGPDLPDAKLCRTAGQVNQGIFDNACRQTKIIYLGHVLSNDDRIYVSRELDHFCVVKKDIFIKTFDEFCAEYSHFVHNRYSYIKIRQYYQYAHIFLNEIQVRIITMLKSIHFQILTNMDLEMTSTVLMGAIHTDTDYVYHVNMISDINTNIRINILNNTFTKVHLHLDNSRISAHIKDNIFIEGGITISSTSSFTNQPVILDHNTFQGNTSNTILEIRNTKDVIITASLFQNSQHSFQHILDKNIVNNNANAGVLCYNSHLEIHDSLFENVSFFPVIHFENCLFVSNNLTMINNDLSTFITRSDESQRYSLIHMKHSEGLMEGSKFKSNAGLNCFYATGGNISFVNMIAVGNKGVRVGRITAGTLTIYNATVVNNTGSIFYSAHSVITISSSIFTHNADVSTYYDVLLIFETTDVTITDSVFEKNGQNLIFIEGPLQNP